jgi:hypothetical protein
MVVILPALPAFILTHDPCQANKDALVGYLGAQPLKTLNPVYTTGRQGLVLYHNWGDTLYLLICVQNRRA